MTRIAQTYPQFAVQLANAGWSSAELTSVRTAFDLAASLFTAAERGSGKPFIDHLVGTASGVLLGGGSTDAVVAALLHSVYDQGDFGDGRTGAQAVRRRRIASVVGAGVEDLVFRYHRLGWGPAVAANAVANVGGASEPERAVLLMRVANEVDDAVDGGLVLSGKEHLPGYGAQVHEAAVALAERVGTRDFASLARRELLGEPPAFPPELIVGAVASRVRMPASARLRLRVQAVRMGMPVVRFSYRLRRRLSPKVKRPPH